MNRIVGFVAWLALIAVGVVLLGTRIERTRAELGDEQADLMVIVSIVAGLVLAAILALYFFSIRIRHRRIRGSSDERMVFETERTPALQTVVNDTSQFPAAPLPRTLSISIDRDAIAVWAGVLSSRRLASIPLTRVIDAVAVGDTGLEIRLTASANLRLKIVAPALPNGAVNPSFVAALVARVNEHAAGKPRVT